MTERLGQDPERAAFERWASEDGRWSQAIERSGNGYMLMSTHSAWMAWRACWPQAMAAERERLAAHFDSRDKGSGGYYEPHEPAEIIRALGPNDQDERRR